MNDLDQAAFPSQPKWWDPDDKAYKEGDAIHGMTLRDYFAAKAMHASLSAVEARKESTLYKDLAEAAYYVADAMLKARQS